MKSSQTFSILIWANKAKASTDGQLPLYARVTVDGKRAEISLKKKVDSLKWNPQSGLMRGNSEGARMVNNYISQIKSQLFKLYNQLQMNGEYITAEAIKLHFIGEKIYRKTLLESVEYHNGQMEKMVGIDVVSATFSQFKTLKNRLTYYIKYRYHKSDFFLDELTHQFVTEFEFYLKTQLSIDHNTTMKYIRNLKKIIAMAVSHSWLAINPFQHFKCSYRKVERNILTSEELQQLAQKHFSIRRLEEIRDVFIFC